MLPKCFVINLESSGNRREFMKDQLQKLGLDYEFFAATNGRELSEAELNQCKTEDRVELSLRLGLKIIIKNKLTAEELGCVMSHLRLYQHILDLGLEQAMIFEDDAVVHPDVKVALDNLDCIKEEWDIVNFSSFLGIHDLPFSHKYHFGDSKDFYFKRVGMHNIYLDIWRNQRRFVGCAAAYVVTKHACEVMLKLGYPVRLPADYLTGLICYNELKMFRVYPFNHYITFGELGSSSTIGGTREHPMERA